MSKLKDFLARKDIVISPQRYLIDALGAMAQGLFASLLIGTIIKTVGQQTGLALLVDLGGYATAMSGPAMACAIGWALHCPPLVLFSLITVGYSANALGGAGGPLAVLIIAIVAAEMGKAVSKETKVDILVTPLVTIFVGVGLSMLIAAPIGAAASKDGSVEEPMKAAIRAAGAEGDSVGGVLETAILGLPAGVGEPYFDSVESKLAHLAFSIPAVKGIEFGSGFDFADQKGSEANDAFRMQGERIVTATNHNAGLNGGISNGMPVVFRTAVKPTPSIYKTQDTVDYIAKKDAELSIQGRHDPCIVPRAAIVQTCAAALAVGDLLTARYGARWMTDPTGYRKED